MQFANLMPVKTIQVRSVPEQTHRELRIRAASAGVSLSDYVLQELERVVSKPSIADVLERAGSRRGGVPRQVIVDAVRDGRDRD